MSYLKKSKLVLLLMLCSFTVLSVMAQERVVTGKVNDQQTGKPLAGVSVKVKNTTTVAVSDAQGNFKVKVPSSESVLSFTYIGYGVYEIKAGLSGNILATLAPSVNNMQDVVVVGYGAKKRIHLTGAVETINMQEVEDLPLGSLSQIIRGQTVGVSTSGGFARPGEPASITVRNPIYFSKDGGSKDPLFVIDDIIRNKSDFDLLDATEIESMSILKDASAAIYGIIGSNGVVVVKTKRGKAGALNVSYNGSYGVSDAPYMPKMLSGFEQAKYLNSYLAGSRAWDMTSTQALAGYYSPDELDYFKNNSTDWLKQAWQSSHNQRHTVNVSGGTERATFFAGISYNENNSNFDGLGFKRYSFRSSSDIKITKALKLGLSLSGELGDKKNTFNKQGNESLDNDWKTMIGMAQFIPPYIDGKPVAIPGAGTSGNINNYHYFAVHDLNNYTATYSSVLNFQGQLSYEVPFIKGLKASANFNKNVANTWGKQYGTKYQVYNFNTTGAKNHILTNTYNAIYTFSNGDRVRINPSLATSYQLNGTLTYDRTFGKHEVGAFFGYEQSESFSDAVAAQVDGVVTGGLDNMNYGTIPVLSNEPISEAGRMAYIGRFNYNYDDRYLLEATMRADASQNFAPENRWGSFPSVSAGWVISQEKFFAPLKDKINFLKLRGSVGFLGLDATKSYQWLRSYAIQTGKAVVYGGNADRGVAVVTNVEIANREVHWDNVDKYNIGLDARFFNNRLSISTDAYIDYRSNMLSNLSSSPSILIGASLPSENFGKANTFGYELSATWKDNINKDWNYKITANYSWSDNKQIVIDQAKGLNGTYLDGLNKSSDMGFLGYKSLGILRSQEQVNALLAKSPNYKILGQAPMPGMLYFQDIRGPKDASGNYTGPDGTITSDDQDYLTPKQSNHYGLGFNMSLSYKKLSLNVVTGMSWGGISSVESAARKVGNNIWQNRPAFWADHWTPDNPNAAYPSPYYAATYDVATDFWFRSSFTFRVTSLNLSYSLPQAIGKKFGFSNARVYMVGTNPFNLYNPYDYKDNVNGSYDVFPQLKTLTFGLNVNF
jgi:TonB-linked SusC/RagA family outer membrane protein